MKKHLIIFIIAIFCTLEEGFPQSVSFSYPQSLSILQRNSSDQATVTIAGQMTSGSTGNPNPSGSSVFYRIKTLNSSGGTTATGSNVSLTIQSTGLFYTTTTLNTGWYSAEILLGSVVIASQKFGVGDVFILAGQSNAQGVATSGNGFGLPDPNTVANPFPEWIVATDYDGNCTRNLPPVPYFFTLNNTSNTYNKIGPTGNSVWAYGALGTLLSKAGGANPTIPIAFFNAASAGSSIKQWWYGRQGLRAGNAYTGNQQFCKGYGGSTDSTYMYGQPFTPLKTSLNYYASMYGIRGVLWHQGEADNDPNLARTPDTLFRTTDSTKYKTRLLDIIATANSQFGNSNLSWFISRVSITNNQAPQNYTRGGQRQSISTGVGRFYGAESDYISTEASANTLSVRHSTDQTHFDEGPTMTYGGGPMGGLSILANKWNIGIANNGNRISANTVPTISVAKVGSSRTFTVPSGASEYRWGTDINNPIAGATSNTYTTTSTSGIRCFIRQGNNWTVTQYVENSCPSCKENNEGESQNEDFGLSLNTYPNPFVKDLTVEFNVANDNSDVKLEIIDNQNQIVRTIAHSSHAAGKWKYLVTDLKIPANRIYYCRLMVGQIFTVQKLIKIE